MKKFVLTVFCGSIMFCQKINSMSNATFVSPSVENIEAHSHNGYADSVAGMSKAFSDFRDTLDRLNLYLKENRNKFATQIEKFSIARLGLIVKRLPGDDAKIQLLSRINTYIQENNSSVSINTILPMFPDHITDRWNDGYQYFILTPEEYAKKVATLNKQRIFEFLMKTAKRYSDIVCIKPKLCDIPSHETATKIFFTNYINKREDHFPKNIALLRNLIEGLADEDRCKVITKFISECPVKPECPNLAKKILSLIFEITLDVVDEYLASMQK